MANATQIATFIQQIAPLCQSAYKIIGKVKPSIAIGMACVECGYGTAGSCKHHSYFGMKVGSGKTATKYWGGKFFTSNTKEEYTIGTHTTIKAAFRAYNSMQEGVLNFYELLNTPLYSKVLADSSYTEQMQQIKACGYMTSSTEVNSVLAIIKRHNLTKYDEVNGNPYREPASNIKKGMCGNAIKWIQYQLNLFGYKLVVDGIFGDKTHEAVVDFQSCHLDSQGRKLAIDGIVGEKTKGALKQL